MKFALPWMLALIPVAALGCHLFFRRAEHRRESRLRAFLGQAYDRQIFLTSGARPWTPRRYFLFLCMAFLIIAGARPFLPAAKDETERRQRIGVDFLIAIDASKSMWARDTETTLDFRQQVKERLIALFKDKVGGEHSKDQKFRREEKPAFDPDQPLSRLQASKEAVRNLLKESHGDRIGLIAFTEEAALRAPLTYDFQALELVLDSIAPANVPPGGSSVEPAIVRAERVFENKNLKRSILVILSDGEEFEGNAASAAARFHQTLNGTIFTVGVGSVAGARIPDGDEKRKRDLVDEFGQTVITRLDKGSLTRIALNSGGRYVDLGKDGNGLLQLYRDQIKPLGDASPDDFQGNVHELFQFPLFLALLALVCEMLIRAKPQRLKTSAVLPS